MRNVALLFLNGLVRYNLLILFASGALSVAEAQKPPLKFGEIPDELFTMTSFPADPTAEAVVIADFGTSEIILNHQTGFQLNFERTRRIKVLTEGGKKWADLAIYLSKDVEKVSMIRGVTVNLENGKKVESTLEKDAVFRDSYNKYINMVKVTLPNVKVGSVFDITYRITSNLTYNFHNWMFQSTIPVLWSEYRAAIPEYFIYDKYAQGYIPMSISETGTHTRALTFNYRGVGSYSENTFRWVAIDVPAFRDEPFMTTRNDFISRLNFELTGIHMPGEVLKEFGGSWSEINQRFAESADVAGEIKGNAFLKKIAMELTAGATTASQKVQILHSYVRETIDWNGQESAAAIKTMRQVLDDKKGSSAEINLLLGSMIEKLDIPVKPVVLSTRDHGFIRESAPALQQFNYVICMVTVENGSMLLDATEKWLPSAILPKRCLNGKRLAVANEGHQWVNLDAPKTRSVTNCELQLAADGTLTGVLKMENGGYRGMEKREKYHAKGADEYLKDLVGSRPWQLSNSEYSNVKELNELFTEKHHIAISEHVTLAGDVMYLNPFITGHWASNPFKAEKREYPVDFGNTFDEVYMTRIKIPAGFVVDEMPGPRAIALPANAARFSMSSTLSGDMVIVTSTLSVNKPLFNSLEYHALREFCNQVVAKQTEQIVIKKN
jgi:hypothetical protein